MTTNEYLRIGEVAKLASMSASTIKRLAESGGFPMHAHRVGARDDGHRRWLAPDVYAWIEKRDAKGASAQCGAA